MVGCFQFNVKWNPNATPFIARMIICKCTRGVLFCGLLYTYATPIITHSYSMSMYLGPLENIQHLYLYSMVTFWGSFYLEVWRRMRSVIMVTNWSMILVHKVVTRKIVLLEKTIQTCARMFFHRDGGDVVADWKWFIWRCGVAKWASTCLGCSNWWTRKCWNALSI